VSPAIRRRASAGRSSSAAVPATRSTWSDLKGQVVLINFWASWCGPCRKEMPILEQLYKQYKSKGFTLLGVNVEPSSADAVNWLKSHACLFSDTVRHWTARSVSCMRSRACPAP
jgi:thiol-disulfide isomerase/thioredoxin